MSKKAELVAAGVWISGRASLTARNDLVFWNVYKRETDGRVSEHFTGHRAHGPAPRRPPKCRTTTVFAGSRRVNTSRASFAARFPRNVGERLMNYLTRWCVTLVVAPYCKRRIPLPPQPDTTMPTHSVQSSKGTAEPHHSHCRPPVLSSSTTGLGESANMGRVQADPLSGNLGRHHTTAGFDVTWSALTGSLGL